VMTQQQRNDPRPLFAAARQHGVELAHT
jgi:hypothetical protein